MACSNCFFRTPLLFCFFSLRLHLPFVTGPLIFELKQDLQIGNGCFHPTFFLFFISSCETISSSSKHRWEFPRNYPVFTVVMVIYHYVERIWRILITPVFCITYMTINIYYSGEPVNIHIQSLINITQEKNWVITTKKG